MYFLFHVNQFFQYCKYKGYSYDAGVKKNQMKVNLVRQICFRIKFDVRRERITYKSCVVKFSILSFILRF